jgi:hypothetical protein
VGVAPSTRRDGGMIRPRMFSGVGASMPPAKAASPLPVPTRLGAALLARGIAFHADEGVDALGVDRVGLHFAQRPVGLDQLVLALLDHRRLVAEPLSFPRASPRRRG